MKTITVKNCTRTGFIDITDEVKQVVAESSVKVGICIFCVPHSTAGITINEGPIIP